MLQDRPKSVPVRSAGLDDAFDFERATLFRLHHSLQLRVRILLVTRHCQAYSTAALAFSNTVLVCLIRDQEASAETVR